MNYQSDSQKNKIPKSEIVNQEQSNEIELQEQLNNTIEGRVDKTQPTTQNIGKLHWEVDWELMESSIREGSLRAGFYKAWKFPIGTININWLTHFQVEMIFKNGVDGEGDSTAFILPISTYFNKFIGWELEDLESNPTSDIKTVTLVASLRIENVDWPTEETSITPQFYAKLLINYAGGTNRD
jgi:hypothetical protein